MKRIIGAGRLRKLKGRWQLIVTIEDTETGRKTEKTELTDIRCSASTNLGRASATEALERFRAQVAAATGAYLGPSGSARTASGPCGKTLVEGIGEYIEYRRVTGGISPTTADAYGYSLLHIKRGFPSQLPGEITPDDVRQWIAGSIEQGHSNKVMKKAYGLLKQYFNYLLTLQDPRVTRNPLDAVPRPRPEEPEPNALRRENIEVLNAHLRGMDDCPMKRCCMLSLHAGLRIGEAVSVTWGDVDWKFSTIEIKKSAVRVKGSGMVLKETKGRERRVAPLDPILAGYLMEARAADERIFRSIGHGAETELDRHPIASAMFARPLGTYEDSGRMSKTFSTLSNALGLVGTSGECITFHGLRHTFASQWIACGGDVAALSAILGHKDVGFTLNVYVSPDPVAQRSGALGMLETISAGYASATDVARAVEESGADAFVKLRVPVSIWSRARVCARGIEGMDATDLLVAILQNADIESVARGLANPYGMRSDPYRHPFEAPAAALPPRLDGAREDGSAGRPLGCISKDAENPFGPANPRFIGNRTRH